MEETMQSDRTVHIVDDDAPVRRSLERLLHASGFVTASYESSAALLRVASTLADGCLLLDIRMPGMDGLELQARLNDLGMHLPTIVMTGQGDISMAVRAMKAGAIDFIEKPFDDERLLAAIAEAFARGGQVERRREIADAVRRIAALSRRESEVLEALVGGRASKQIAYDLGISVRTVEVHRARMLERLGVRQLAEAIRLAVMARLGPGNDPPAAGR
jgi:two-component system response regulator FixJ